MVQRTGGARRKTRSKFSKNVRQKGKISTTRFMQTFDTGDRVILHQESAYSGGTYFRRFHGKIGKVSGKKGKCYEVKIKDINVKKTLIVHPVHLKKQV